MKKIKDVHILVVGDIGVDKYIYTEMNRISPEAPVPIVNFKNAKAKLGLAGNVVENIHSIGAKVSFIGSIGDKGGFDSSFISRSLKSKCTNFHLFNKRNSPTTVKQRIIANNQQMILRMDIEDPSPITLNRNELMEGFLDFNSFDVIIISDYDKGFITSGVMNFIQQYKKTDCQILVDPAPSNCWDVYSDVFLIKPNMKEFLLYEDNCLDLHNGSPEFILKTKGKDGMDLFRYCQATQGSCDRLELIQTFKATAQQVYDVTGAGDTVIAILAVCIDMGIGLEESILISNCAAGISVSKQGTYALSKEEFELLLSLSHRIRIS